MEETIKQQFLTLWQRFFSDAPLPFVFYYTDDPGRLATAERPTSQYCVIGQLLAVRRG